MKNRKYGYRIGRVVTQKNDKVEVVLDQKLLKSSCSEKGCNLCSTDTPPVKIWIDKNELLVGDSVMVGTVEINEALAAFLSFMVPIIMAISFYSFAVAGLGWGSEDGATIGFTLVVLLSSVGLLFGVNSIIKKIYPIEVEKIDETKVLETPLNQESC
jgi:hypothetical protein